ncbi:MAG: phosphatase PAP2 family protein [Candidatus Micrarchaeota archaeon]|nr:phosphatase PAP2 family protein [Candidatus Micrarchaeota archaeon]
MGIFDSLNNAAFQAAGSVASPALTATMQYLAPSYYVVLLAIILYLYLRKDKNVFSFAAAAVLLAVADEIIKDIVKEPRPCTAQPLPWTGGYCESGFGFPSNHASTLSGLLFFIKGYRYLRWMYLIWLALVLFGRVYLGVHYFTDVIAGIVISVVVAAIIYKLRHRINHILASIAHRIAPFLFKREWVG